MKTTFLQRDGKQSGCAVTAKEIHFNLHRCLYWDVTETIPGARSCAVYSAKVMTSPSRTGSQNKLPAQRNAGQRSGLL